MHIQLIAPYLARHGVAYERQKFAERVAKGESSTANVEEWLIDAVNTLLGPGAGGAEEKERLIQGILRGEGKVQKEMFAHAFIQLVKKVEVYRAKLPETMSWDGRRIGKLRDEIDTISLISVFTALLRQFLLDSGVPAPPPLLRDVEKRLYLILQDTKGGALNNLVDEVLEGAKRAFGFAGKVLSNEGQAQLRSVLSNAASTGNPIFGIMFNRVSELFYWSLVDPTRATELRRRWGLAGFEAALEAGGREAKRVYEHTWAVHGQLYTKTIRDAAALL